LERLPRVSIGELILRCYTPSPPHPELARQAFRWRSCGFHWASTMWPKFPAATTAQCPGRYTESLLFTYRAEALRGKTGADKAEAAGHGGSMFKADNAVWPSFCRYRKDGAASPDPGVARRSSTLRTVRFSLLGLGKIRSRRFRPISE
jgi:hypothetical protein